jgi:hypothetical protein
MIGRRWIDVFVYFFSIVFKSSVETKLFFLHPIKTNECNFLLIAHTLPFHTIKRRTEKNYFVSDTSALTTTTTLSSLFGFHGLFDTTNAGDSLLKCPNSEKA